MKSLSTNQLLLLFMVGFCVPFIIIYGMYSIFNPDRETRKYIFLSLTSIAVIVVISMYFFPNMFSTINLVFIFLSLVYNISFLLMIDILSYVFDIEIFSYEKIKE